MSSAARLIASAAWSLTAALLIGGTASAQLLPDPSTVPDRTVVGLLGPDLNPQAMRPMVRPLTAAEADRIRAVEAGGNGDWLKAETDWREVLALMRATFGPSHPLTGQATMQLGRALSGQLREAEATDTYRAGVAILDRALGHSHPEVMDATETLIQSLNMQTRYKDAEPLLRRQLAAVQARVKPGDDRLNRYRQDLANNLSEQKRPADAAEAAPAVGSGRSGTAVERALATITALVSDQRWAEAEPALTHLLKTLRTGPADLTLPMAEKLVLGFLVTAMQRNDHLAQAGPYIERVIAAQAAQEDPANEPAEFGAAAGMQELLGTAMLRGGRAAQALPVLSKACDVEARFSSVNDKEVLLATSDPRGAPACREQLARAMLLAGSPDRRALERAFTEVQPATSSAAGAALGRQASRVAAVAVGQGGSLERLDRIAAEQSALGKAMDGQIDQNTGNAAVAGRAAAEERARIEGEQATLGARGRAVLADMTARTPDFAAFLNPLPVTVAELQGGAGQ